MITNINTNISFTGSITTSVHIRESVKVLVFIVLSMLELVLVLFVVLVLCLIYIYIYIYIYEYEFYCVGVLTLVVVSSLYLIPLIYSGGGHIKLETM